MSTLLNICWIRNRGAKPCSASRMPITVFLRYWPEACTYNIAENIKTNAYISQRQLAKVVKRKNIS